MMDDDDEIEPIEVGYFAERAVDELIQDASSGRLLQNRELAEVIMGCIRETSPKQLTNLKRLLKQRSLERPDLEHKHPDFRG